METGEPLTNLAKSVSSSLNESPCLEMHRVTEEDTYVNFWLHIYMYIWASARACTHTTLSIRIKDFI